MTRRVRSIPGSFTPTVFGMPDTVDMLRQLQPFEFQNWVIQQFFGVASARKSGDMRIDGYAFFTHESLQVKRSDEVGRNVVDNFEPPSAVTVLRGDASWHSASPKMRAKRPRAQNGTTRSMLSWSLWRTC